MTDKLATKKSNNNRAPRPAKPDQVLLSGQQASASYGPPYRSLMDLHYRGVLPAVRLPGSRRLWFRRADLDALIARSIEAIA